MESIEQIVDQPELLSLCNAGGVSISFGKQIYTNGDVPAHKPVQKLNEVLFAKSGGLNFKTHHISADMPQIDFECGSNSGLTYWLMQEN